MTTDYFSDLQAECPDLFTADQWAELSKSHHVCPLPELDEIKTDGFETAQPDPEPINERARFEIEYLERVFSDAIATHTPNPSPINIGLPFPLPDFSDPPYEFKTRKDRSGTHWEFLPPGTPVRSGDQVDEGGIWRPTPSLRRLSGRYERAHFIHSEAQARHDATVQLHGADSLQAREAASEAARALEHRQAALKDSDNPTTKDRDRIDAYRRDNPETYNASRRKTARGANTDLSGLTDEERAEHKRKQAAERKRKQRAAKALSTLGNA